MSKGTVLIIEDHPFNLHMAKELLQHAGLETLSAEDAETGIRLTREHKPNLVLMDMHMPVMDGYEASQALKSDPATCDIPIVAFTALAMENEQAKAIASGCVGVIVKPIDVDRFAETVQSFMRPATNMNN